MKMYTFLILLFCVGCDTITYYKSSVMPPPSETQKIGKITFTHSDKEGGVELSGTVYLFNFNIIADISIKNTANKKLFFEPKAIKIKSIAANKYLELKNIKGENKKLDSINTPITFQASETKLFHFKFDAHTFMPTRIKNNSAMEKLSLELNGLQRDTQIKPILIQIVRES
ncbi:MAG: hypothetical protein IPM57_03850 [Oligoflexia bacterium]|nr:hypothetical protein [Oligoflexia bacterium]